LTPGAIPGKQAGKGAAEQQRTSGGDGDPSATAAMLEHALQLVGRRGSLRGRRHLVEHLVNRRHR
jgi:hypothetical protein